MSTLLVGGAGFIGSALARRLCEWGQPVTVFNRTGTNLRNLASIDARIRPIEGHLADQVALAKGLTNNKTVVYLVHSNTTSPLESDPSVELQENLPPVLSVIRMAAEAGTKRFIFLSSGGTVYGRARELPIPETHSTEPISSYGVCKLAMEHYVRISCESCGMESVIVRIANTYGKGKKLGTRQGIVPELVNCILKDKPLELWGDGTVVRDYIHLDDVCDVLASAIEKPLPSSTFTFNLGTGIGTSVNQIVALAEAKLKKPAHIIRKNARLVDVPENILSIRRVSAWLEWNPKIGIASGIDLLCDFYAGSHA